MCPSTAEKCQWSDIVCKLSKVTLSESNCAIYCCFHPPVVKICFYSSCSIVETHLLVYRHYYRYFARNSAFFVCILSVFWGNFGLCNILRPRLQPWICLFLHAKKDYQVGMRNIIHLCPWVVWTCLGCWRVFPFGHAATWYSCLPWYAYHPGFTWLA